WHSQLWLVECLLPGGNKEKKESCSAAGVVAAFVASHADY
ncbi:mucin TcMUCII, putative, partial [Trypanosoma cruzi]